MTDMRKWINLIEEQGVPYADPNGDHEEGWDVLVDGKVIGYIFTPFGYSVWSGNFLHSEIVAVANSNVNRDEATDDNIVGREDLWNYVGYDEEEIQQQIDMGTKFWDRADAHNIEAKIAKEILYPKLLKAWNGKNNKLLKRFRR